MEKTDTIKLLQECDAGSKMAVTSIDELLDKVSDPELASLLEESKKHQEKLGNDLHSMLNHKESDEKEPNPMAKGMSKMKTGMKLSMQETDATIADLMTDGCNMGVKSLSRYLNQYKAADEVSKDIAKRLIKQEDQLILNARPYL